MVTISLIKVERFFDIDREAGTESDHVFLNEIARVFK